MSANLWDRFIARFLLRRDAKIRELPGHRVVSAGPILADHEPGVLARAATKAPYDFARVKRRRQIAALSRARNR